MSQSHTLALMELPEMGMVRIAHTQYHWPAPGRWHMHQAMQFLLIIKGNTDLSWQGHSDCVELAAGSLCAIAPDLPHRIESVGQRHGVELIDIHIDLAHHCELAQAWRRQVQEVHVAQAANGVTLQAVQWLQQASDLTGPGRSAGLTGLGWLMLSLTMPRPAYARDALDHRIAAAERFMADHLQQPIGTPDIAEACALSVSQLNRLFRQHRQTTPAQRLLAMRIDYAREMLPASLLTLKAIARDCGFVCVNHFIRVFREQVGVTPGVYRQQQATIHGRERIIKTREQEKTSTPIRRRG